MASFRCVGFHCSETRLRLSVRPERQREHRAEQEAHRRASDDERGEVTKPLLRPPCARAAPRARRCPISPSHTDTYLVAAQPRPTPAPPPAAQCAHDRSTDRVTRTSHLGWFRDSPAPCFIRVSRRAMARLLILAALILAMGAAACSALVTFDRSKITDDKHGGGASDGGASSGDGGAKVKGDSGSRCAPGSAGSPCEPCKAGEYCAGGAAPAVSCPTGQWDHDHNPATPCAPQRECPPGEFVSSVGSSTEDRTCAPCASARFSAHPNSAVCDGWTTCVVGQYVAEAGTTVKDQKCAACPSGMYSDAPNSGQCVPFDACAAGTKQTVPGKSGACSPCAVGEYCAGASTVPQACTDGTWDHDANPASPCVPWTACGPARGRPGRRPSIECAALAKPARSARRTMLSRAQSGPIAPRVSP